MARNFGSRRNVRADSREGSLPFLPSSESPEVASPRERRDGSNSGWVAMRSMVSGASPACSGQSFTPKAMTSSVMPAMTANGTVAHWEPSMRYVCVYSTVEKDPKRIPMDVKPWTVPFLVGNQLVMSTGTVLYPQAEEAAFAATMATTKRPALEDMPMSRMPAQ